MRTLPAIYSCASLTAPFTKGGKEDTKNPALLLCRARLAEDHTQQLREDAAQAAQRAASADMKVEVLQKAVQQAEERAAALEMQVSVLSAALILGSDQHKHKACKFTVTHLPQQRCRCTPGQACWATSRMVSAAAR